MGERVQRASSAEEIRVFTRRLLNDVRALERMHEKGMIESGIRRIGAEQELFLVDSSWRPAPEGDAVLALLDDPRIGPELGLFNLEFNTEPLPFEDDCLGRLEEQVLALLTVVRDAAMQRGAQVVLTGILPTLRKSDLDLDNMTPLDRYRALNEALNRLRGGAYNFYIRGTDELLVKHESMMLEACNTSFQVHFQVGPEEFARLYNAALVATAPVLAAATNSPLLFGRRLWQETRIALFQQSIDTRSAMPHVRDIQPRVSFGTRWVEESVLDIFREDIARFRVLLGTEIDEEPLEMVSRGEVPRLQALQLFNSTVYRWNRPCYGVDRNGNPHLRIENRVLPSGPSPRDEIANAAFWYGLVSGLARRHEDVRELIAFDEARANFVAAARLGLGAPFTWLEGEEVEARRLILDRLLEVAHEGLTESGIRTGDVDRYLGVVRDRVDARRTGATWLLHSLGEMQGEESVEEKLVALTAATAARQREGTPVHEWTLAELTESAGWRATYHRIDQYMPTDLVTVTEDEPVDLVANLMDWHHIRHVPVEDSEHRLVGLVTRRTLLRFLATDEAREAGNPVPVSQIMERDLVTVTPETSTLEAIQLMRDHGISCLPVIRDGHLVSMITEREFMRIARQLLEEKLRQ